MLLLYYFPFIGSLMAGLIGRKIGGQGAGYLTTSLLFLAWLSVVIIGINTWSDNSWYMVDMGDWIPTETLNLTWIFSIDPVSLIMALLVTFVSLLVHIYSTGYMSEDPHLPRFLSYLSLFTLFILILVTGHSIVVLFIGWEGVGLCSYLLINFWYTRQEATKAAVKAIVINRIGDWGFVVGIAYIVWTIGTLNMIPVLGLHGWGDSTVIIMGLFIGSIAKSAQIGLHTWLPDAIEGPTPVSALIHAATMVTAGVYLLLRVSPILEESTEILNTIIIVGALTAFFGATVGTAQNDIKKVVAYSTCSQLGYMVLACGSSQYNTGLFHLWNHGFFKALLFLAAGSIIHSLGDEQDIRKSGGLLGTIPVTYVAIIIGSLALIGFPYLAGFYSKEAILESVHAYWSVGGLAGYWLALISAGLTAYYSTRSFYLTFLGRSNTLKGSIHESDWRINSPLLFLSLASLVSGYLFIDLFLGLGNEFLQLGLNTKSILHWQGEQFDLLDKILPLIVSIIGILISLKYFHKLSPLSFFQKRWYFDELGNEIVGSYIGKWGLNYSYKLVDRGVLEYVGPTGIVNLAWRWLEKQRKWFQGYFDQYALILFLGSLLLISNWNVIWLLALVWLLEKWKQ